MSRFVEIKLTKTRLFLTEQELYDALPEALVVTGLQRAKAFKRTKDLNERSDLKVNEMIRKRGGF